jgi:hypothetical protein
MTRATTSGTRGPGPTDPVVWARCAARGCPHRFARSEGVGTVWCSEHAAMATEEARHLARIEAMIAGRS